MQPQQQMQPIEFLVSGGLGGTNTSVDQYSSVGPGGYTSTRTTTTTTRRTMVPSDTGGYMETSNTSFTRGARPFDQVEFVLQPDASTSSSSSKFLTTSIGMDQEHAPYFAVALHDRSVREGESVLFEVMVSGE